MFVNHTYWLGAVPATLVLCLLPTLLDLPCKVEDIWYSSNSEEPDYATMVLEEFAPVLSKDERSWMMEQLESGRFRMVRSEYISTFRALQNENNVQRRRDILDRWYKLTAQQTGRP